MRKISDEDKRDVFERWLNGDSYRKILEEKYIGLGSTSEIIDEVRKQNPDIDDLRKLNVRLKKGGFTVYDAVRACVLLEHLNNYGISVSELKDYVDHSRRILSDKKLEDNVMTYAFRLVQLERKYGRPYEKVMEDFNRLDEETEGMKAENAELKKKNKELKEEVGNKIEKNRQLDAEHLEISNKLAKVTMAYKQLRDFEPEKLQKLANFAHDIDTLDISVEEVQKLVILKKELTKLGFDTDNVKKDAVSILSLSSRADELKNTTNELMTTQPALLEAYRILQNNTIGIPCKNCSHPIDVPLPTKQQYQSFASSGKHVPMTCGQCGSPQKFSLPEIAQEVGWNLLP